MIDGGQEEVAVQPNAELNPYEVAGVFGLGGLLGIVMLSVSGGVGAALFLFGALAGGAALRAGFLSTAGFGVTVSLGALASIRSIVEFQYRSPATALASAARVAFPWAISFGVVAVIALLPLVRFGVRSYLTAVLGFSAGGAAAGLAFTALQFATNKEILV